MVGSISGKECMELTVKEALLVSVIVPIYNVEKYLDECVKSLVVQTYTNIEIILIDDGSKDASGNIADNWAKEDKRIKVVHQNNKGLAAARNVGLDIASGEYVCMVDSDDYVAENYVKDFVALLEENQADIAMCNLWSIGTVTSRLNSRMPSIKMCMEPQYFLEKLYTYTGIYSMVTNKMYRSSVFENIRFDEDKINEDARIMLSLINQSNKVAYTPEGLYKYRRRSTSIMNGSKKIDLWKNEIDWIQTHLNYFKDVDNQTLYILALKLYFNKNVEYYVYLNKLLKKSVKANIKRAGRELIRKKELNCKQKLKMIFCMFYPYIYSKYLLKSGEQDRREFWP